MPFTVEFKGTGRQASCAANPKFPNGIDLDISGGKPSCTVEFPYPAPEVGVWIVVCEACGLRGAITTAGRPDDPRSAKLACRRPDVVQ